VPLEMTEGNYSNVGHRGSVYKGLGAMNPCDNLQDGSRKIGCDGRWMQLAQDHVQWLSLVLVVLNLLVLLPELVNY
jgi:hypothetical protein